MGPIVFFIGGLRALEREERGRGIDMQNELAELKAVPIGTARALAQSSESKVAIYLPGSTGRDGVLYRGDHVGLPDVDFRKLAANGLDHLLIDAADLHRCERALESELADILFNPTIDANQKAACAQQVGVNLARDFLTASHPGVHLDRAAQLIDTLIDGVLGDHYVAGSLLSMSAHHQTTASHLFAVGAMSTMLAYEVLGHQADALRAIALAGLLHDLGKMSLDSELLSKTTPLTPAELLLIRQHPIESVRLIGDNPNATKEVRLMILQHHERFDGRGYPLGLKGDEAVLGSRIIAITDAFHAMIGRRAYRQELAPQEAISKMRFQVGAQFDPELFDVWVRLFKRSLCTNDTPLATAIEETLDPSPGYHLDHRSAKRTTVARRSARQVCRSDVKARCLRTGRLPGMSGQWGTIECPIRDVSRSGAKIDLAEPMYRGEIVSAMLKTNGDEQWLRAVVRWCRRNAYGEFPYQAGIQFLHRISAAEAHSEMPMMGIATEEEVLAAV